MALAMNLASVQVPAYIPIGKLIQDGAFNDSTLTGSVQGVPYTPQMLGQRGVFDYTQSLTNKLSIEFDKQAINILEVQPIGGPPIEIDLADRKMISYIAPRIVEEVTIVAEEVMNLRQLGDVNLATVQTQADRKIRLAVRNIFATHEYHRIGAAFGKTLNPSGSTIHDFFTDLGITPTTILFHLDDATTKIQEKCLLVMDALEDALGAFANMGEPLVYCGRAFWKALITHPSVQTAYQYYVNSGANGVVEPLRDGVTMRYKGFSFGGLEFVQYRGKASGITFLPDDEARVIPYQVEGTYLGIFCPPADDLAQVGQPGLPVTATIQMLPHNEGYRIKMQSNVFHACTRPEISIKLSRLST